MFTRIQLPYATDALEPHIDKETVETHYGAHHKTYTEKFNELVDKVPAFKGMDALDILRNLDKAPEELRTGLRNNGGGYYIHNLYFESLTPQSPAPSQAFSKAVCDRFNTFDAMLSELKGAATVKLFGSGWAWLVMKNGKMDVVITPNQDLPPADCTMLLPVDMWEHAYYLKFKNKKADYVDHLFMVINWNKVEERMNQAR